MSDLAPTVTATASLPEAAASVVQAAAPQTGNQITATTGTWQGASNSGYGYQWLRCNALGAACSSIGGATSATYTISPVSTSDAGTYDVVVTSSTNASVTSTSATLTVSVTSSSLSTLNNNVVAAAQAFLATLSTSQQSTVQLSYSLATARHWSNLPAAMVSRNGVSWGALSTAQKTAARTLISTALSSDGNSLHIGMQAADDKLVSGYNASSSTYGNGNYYIAFLGTPSTSSFWMLQLTGHHLTYNLAFNGSYASATPMFLGIEPKDGFTLNGVSYDPMSAQRTAVASLASSIGSYSAAKLSGSYSDLLFGANGTGGIDGTLPKSYPSGTSGRGVLYSALSSTDQAKVIAVIKAYVNTQAGAMADDLLGAYLGDSALAATYVAYAGSTSLSTQGAYFRVDGPRVWIEFSVQNGVIISGDVHFHTIWRDKSGDYGGMF